MIGLYVHVPFCLKKCHYCDFVITAKGSAAKRSAFLSALEREAAFWGRGGFETRPYVFDTVYIGGGTPSALDAAETGRLFEIIRKNFEIKQDAEITFEVNPGDKILDRKQLGVNRVSLGAQSFNEEVLRAMNRAHGVKEIYESFSSLRAAGISNISLDLMLCLPGQTLQDAKHSLEQAVKLGPEHISLYELTVEEKTEFGKRQREGRLALPDEALQLEMLESARATFKENGFRHYELLSYAKPGFESRHNRIYWTSGEYLGLGPGACSYIDGRRFKRAASFEEYMRKIEARDWSLCEDEVLPPEKKEAEALVLALRLAEGADRNEFRSVLSQLEPHVNELKNKGLLEEKEDRIRLTSRGALFAESVFSELVMI